MNEIYEIEKLEKQLDEKNKEINLFRLLLWLNHGCDFSNLYGDDGEMQCNKCIIDFKRSKPEDILEKWYENSMKEING